MACNPISCHLTLPKTNIAPENGWLEDYFPFGKTYFRGYVSFREGSDGLFVFLFYLVLNWD